MDFDPSFLYQFSDLSMIVPKNTRNSEIPIMVPLQQTSTLVTPPPKNIHFYSQDNFHHSQTNNHPFNVEYHDPCFLKKSPPSSNINPLSMFQTLSLGDSYSNWSHKNGVNSNYPIGFAPNNDKMGVSSHDEYLNNCNNRFLDFPQEIPNLYDPISSQPLVGLSLPPPPPDNVYAPVVVNNHMLQNELSNITRAQNNGHGDKKQKIIANKIKGKWNPDEDRVLVDAVRRYGLRKWSRIAKLLNGRVGKQCRERWFNHLRPNIRKDSWSEEEDMILIEAHREIGNKWAEIAKRLIGRTENTVKNHWNATKRRLNTKKRFNNNQINANGKLLFNYIKQVSQNGK